MIHRTAIAIRRHQVRFWLGVNTRTEKRLCRAYDRLVAAEAKA